MVTIRMAIFVSGLMLGCFAAAAVTCTVFSVWFYAGLSWFLTIVETVHLCVLVRKRRRARDRARDRAKHLTAPRYFPGPY